MPQLAPRSPADHYLSATTASLDRAVADLVLSEPTVRDPAHATRVIERLLETLAGLAIGSLVGAVIAGVARTLGVDVAPAVDRALAPTARAPAPRLDDEAPPRSLGGELKHQLRRRIAIDARETGVVLGRIDRMIAPGDRATFGRMVGLLANDDLVAERFAHQLRAGWRCAVAVIEGRTVPAMTPIWQQWAARLAGARPVITPVDGPEVILRIA